MGSLPVCVPHADRQALSVHLRARSLMGFLDARGSIIILAGSVVALGGLMYTIV